MSRAPFFSRCPVCEEAATSPVVEFAQLVFVRCAGCGLIYKREQAPALSKPYEEEYFRFNRAKYLERWEHRVRKCRRQVLACLEYAPHAQSLLDVGCSAGYVLAAGKSLGLKVTGLDLSKFAVGLCREKGFAAEVGSFEAMPFPDASFDIVTAKHTLEHVAAPMTALREVTRVLKPGGVAFLVVPDAAYFKIPLIPRIARAFRPDRRGWQHHVYFYARNLADAASRAGMNPAKAGKDIFRRRLAKGPRALWERARFALLWAWTGLCAVTRTRREIQLIARKPADLARQMPAASASRAG